MKRSFDGQNENVNGNDNDDPNYNQPIDQQRKQQLKFTRFLFRGELRQHYLPVEKKLREIVGEEADQAVLRFQQSDRLLSNQVGQSEPRKFKLHFEGKLPSELFTWNKVETAESLGVKVVLLDALTGRVAEQGPLSSLKVEIVVLHGDFKVEQLEDWTQQQFDKKIVPTRVDKGPLLVGEYEIALHNGSGFINNIRFSDNSSWVRSKKFRLGARAFGGKEDQVREAVSGPFKVKHRRGEANQKHQNPSPEDEVWRLNGIAKDGTIHELLAKHKIHKVKDLVHFDPKLLPRTLGRTLKTLKESVKQVNSSLARIKETKPSDVAPFDIPTELINPTTTASLHLQLLCDPASVQDQLEMPVSNNHVTSYGHQFHQLSLPPNQEPVQVQSDFIDNSSLMSLQLAGSGLSDETHCYSLNHPVTPLFSTYPLQGQGTLDVPDSNWFRVAQPTGEEGNGLFVACNNEFHIQQLPLFRDIADSSTSNITKPETGWSKIRAMLRILVKHDGATIKKGKFPIQY